MSIQITISNEGKIPSLCQYPQQCQPQNAYLYFKPGYESLELVADYTSEIGNNVMSFDVFHGRELRFSVTPYATRESLEALADDAELEKMLAEIRDSYDEVWDGNNYVGRYEGLDEYFQEAIERHLADVLVQGEACEAGDWIYDTLDIKELIEKGGVAGYAKHYEELADSEGVTLIGDVEDCITSWAVDAAQRYTSRHSEGDAQIRKICEMLNELDADEYGYLLNDYIEEFESDEE